MGVSDAAVTLVFTLYYVILDILGLLTRLFIPFAWVFRLQWFLSLSESFLWCVSSTVTGGMIAVAVVTIVGARADVFVIRLVALVALLDACLQIVGGAIFGVYPSSKTLLGPLAVHLPFFALAFGLEDALFNPRKHLFRYGLFCALVSLVFVSSNFVAAGFSTGPFLLRVLAVGVASFLVTPREFWRKMYDFFERITKALAAAASSCYLLLTRVWPYIRGFIVRLWVFLDQNPLSMMLKTYILFPLWRFLSPFAMPCVMGLFVLGFIDAILPQPLNSVGSASRMAALLFCLTSAVLTWFVLSLHAVGRVFVGQQDFDPLRFPLVCQIIRAASLVLRVPFTLARVIVEKLLEGRIMRLIARSWRAAIRFARDQPLAGLVVAVLANAVLLVLFFLTGSMRATVTNALWRGAVAVVHDFTVLHGASAPDSIMAVVLVVGSQSCMWALAELVLFQVFPKREDLAIANELAEGMGDPRQCARCAFGPVDYVGCNSLRTHHGEARGGGRYVDNSCPRCGWFVPSTDLWPYWQTNRAADRVVRVRVFGEIVVGLRASAKALCVPILLFKLTPGWPSVGALLALSYLIPWAFENATLFFNVYDATIFKTWRRYPARNLRGAPAAAARRDNDDDCGRRPDPVRAPRVTPSEALEGILNAAPPQIFLEKDAACSICLEEFSGEAFEASKVNAQAMRACNVAPLRCGHVLHMACAQQLVGVAAENPRHFRCPLCREPLSDTGAYSARCFN